MSFLRRFANFIIVSVVVGSCLFTYFSAPLYAQQQPQANSASIAQGFETADTEVKTGALVGLEPGKNNSVQLSNADRADALLGVVGAEPLLEIGSGGTVQVVTSGVTLALVSDINGAITAGDKIAPSPIAGIGMKATSSSVVVGTAQAELASIKTTDHFITDTDGKVHTIKAGLMPVQVNVTFYAVTGEAASYVPAFLQAAANSIAGRQVSPVRVLVALVVVLAAFVSIGILLYASVRSSIISIGRNPLSEGAVRKSLLQVGAMIIGILLITVIAIYLILTT